MLVVGGALFISPIFLGYFPDMPASWNVWLSGILTLALAAAAKQQNQWPADWRR